MAVLDGLRFVAALSVVLFHFGGQAANTSEKIWGQANAVMFPRAQGVFAFGLLGVELFFLISGFVICMSAWGRSPRQFFVSRVARLYPMYWVAVLLTSAVLVSVTTPLAAPSFDTVLTNLTMLQTPLGVSNVDSVYWSLWPELAFYLSFSTVVWRGVTYGRVVVFGGVWIVAAALAPAVDNQAYTLLVNPMSAPYFVAGMVFYLMHRFRPTPLLWGIVGMSWLLGLHYLLARTDGRLDWEMWSPRQASLILLITTFYLLIAAVALGWTARIRWHWLSVAGSITFPLYVIHYSIGVTIIHALRDRVAPWPLFTGVVVGMVITAYVLHRVVERPLGRWMRRALTSDSFTLREPAGR
ncbi:acyltransferase family protein [Embleya sp. NPDC020630]|uniref:acyltransferase family protein n=1 Tax=Embleya sp. NPDC020630 TaxID=3363979 RepID=UPI00378754FB